MTSTEEPEVVWVVRSLRRRDGEPLHFEMTPEDRTAPVVTFDVEERRDRLQLVALTLTARPKGRGLLAADLARVNVDRLLRAALEAATGRTAGTAAYRAATRPGRPRKVDRDLLEQVARTYNENSDWKPRQAVADAHDVSLRTASNYIKEAREEGLIP